MKNKTSIFFLAMAGIFLLASSQAGAEPAPTATQITVYKDKSCVCCDTWVDHLRTEGFEVIAKNQTNMPEIKANFGVSRNLQSCHTAIVDGYVVEGHVPAADIKRMLREKPDVLGLTAPGMPQKSPGMQPEGLPPKDYDVLSFDHKGKVELFQRY